jgi:hypothetical protein
MIYGLIKLGAIEKKSVIVPRFEGYVNFNELRPNKERTKLEIEGNYSMTQDEFIKLLMLGKDYKEDKTEQPELF